MYITIIAILIVASLTAVTAVQEDSSPISEGPIWERNYDGEERIEIYPDSNGNLILIQGSNLDMIGSDGEKIFSKSFSNDVVGRPTVKDDRLYVQTQESWKSIGEKKTRLYCLDYHDDSKIWKRKLEDACLNILVTDNQEIYLIHGSEGNITKLSSDGEVIWRKEYPSPSYTSYGHILYDGIVEDRIVVLYLNSDSASKILCLSSDGNVEWRNSIKEENIKTVQVDSGTQTTYISTSKKIYRVDTHGEMDTLHEVGEGEYIDDFRFKNDKFYYIIKDHKKNLENYRENHTYHVYLRSMYKEGEEVSNVSLGKLQWNNELVGTEVASMSIPGNGRIYCQYTNITEDHEYNVFKIKAFDLEGDQKWHHRYDDGKVHSYHRISKEGVIVTKTNEGKVYAYQGHDPGSGSKIFLYVGFGIILIMLTIVVLLTYYHKNHI